MPFSFQPYDPTANAGTILDLMMRGPRAHADAARASAAARARAMEVEGQSAANIAGSLGAIASNVGTQAAQYYSPEGQALRAQRQASADQRQQQIAEKSAAAQRQSAVDWVLKDSLTTDPDTGLVTYDRGKLTTGLSGLQLPPEDRDKYVKLLDSSDSAVKTARAAQTDALKQIATLVDATGNDAVVFRAEVKRAIDNGIISERMAAPYMAAAQRDPAHIARITGSIIGKPPEKPIEVQPGNTLVSPTQTNPDGTPKVLYTAPAKPADPSASYKEWQEVNKDRATRGEKPYSFEQYQTLDANRKKPAPPRINIDLTSQKDVKDAVAGMMDGTIPPQLPGRASKEYVAVMAEAKRQGYDLAGAATDWMATQKHISTMNGAQQLRLNQAVNSLPEMLDNVEALAKKWQGGRFAPLNKANLAAAKAGAYGKDAASIANQLDAQIADVVADLGNVYMGGNSPTERALELAGKSLKAEWDERVLTDMVGLARKNVQIRRNSINNTGVAGASDENPYSAQKARVYYDANGNPIGNPIKK